MQLKSFGCSHIWGSELGGQKNSAPAHWRISQMPPDHVSFSHLTWPALLAQKLGFIYRCHAWPGRGNFFIACQVLEHLARQQPAFYVINWTNIDRYDYFDSDNGWQTLLPGSTDFAPSDCYYRHLHSQFQDKLVNLQRMKLVADALLAAEQPFVMTYTDDIIFDQQFHTTLAIQSQQQFLKPLMLHWPDGSWYTWVKNQGHAVGNENHVLESGHQAVFEDVWARLEQNSVLTASQLLIHKV